MSAMSASNRPRLALRGSIALAVILLGLLAADALRLWRQHQVNARILAAEAQTLRAGDALEVVHAEALRQAHLGNARAAHDLYARVALGARSELRLRAEYNHANLLLREALALTESGDEAAAMPLLELAKESYRKVLREQPQVWDARYNLERALRLRPEPPDADEGDAQAPRQRERAPTTMRGDTLGLP
jgi:mxaK protein